jgi:predicted naringenin-chalcone synthase
MSLAILGVGTALPLHSIEQKDAARLAKPLLCRTDEEARLLESLYEKTRILKRGSVLLEGRNETGPRQSFFLPAKTECDQGPTTEERMERYIKEAPLLALASAQEALAESGIKAFEMTHLITVSCTGFVAPGFDIALIKELGLNPQVARTHVGFMGCHGAVNGLRVAQAFVEADPKAKVLLVSVELCSLHFSYEWDPGKIVANGIFADGSGALVGVHAKERPSVIWKVRATGSSIFPDSENAMSWKIGNHGFEMTLSAKVPSLIKTYLKPWLGEWLREKSLSLDEIKSWAIHPGGPRVLDAVEAALGLLKEATKVSRTVLGECGNMSSATLLLILKRLRFEKAQKPCLALGFGPGLASEAALFL